MAARPMCENCMAFYPLTKQCRRHAPVMVPVPQTDPMSGRVTGMASTGLYPATEPNGGCCEHMVDPSQLQ